MNILRSCMQTVSPLLSLQMALLFVSPVRLTAVCHVHQAGDNKAIAALQLGHINQPAQGEGFV